MGTWCHDTNLHLSGMRPVAHRWLNTSAKRYSGSLLIWEMLPLCYCIDGSFRLDSLYINQQRQVAPVCGKIFPTTEVCQLCASLMERLSYPCGMRHLSTSLVEPRSYDCGMRQLPKAVGVGLGLRVP